MRLAVIVTTYGSVNRVVHGTYGTMRDVQLLAKDRELDGVGFPSERVVRLPRSLTRGKDFDQVVRATRWWGNIGEPARYDVRSWP